MEQKEKDRIVADIRNYLLDRIMADKTAQEYNLLQVVELTNIFVDYMKERELIK